MMFRATLMLLVAALAFLVTTFTPVEANLSENSLGSPLYSDIKDSLQLFCKLYRTSTICRKLRRRRRRRMRQGNTLLDVAYTGEDYDGADFEDLSEEEVSVLLESALKDGFINVPGRPPFRIPRPPFRIPGRPPFRIPRPPFRIPKPPVRTPRPPVRIPRIPKPPVRTPKPPSFSFSWEKYCKGSSSPMCRKYQLASLADADNADNDVTGGDYDGADFEDVSDEEVAALMESGFFSKLRRGLKKLNGYAPARKASKEINDFNDNVVSPVKKVIKYTSSKIAKACASKLRFLVYRRMPSLRLICQRYPSTLLDVSDDVDDIEDLDAELEALANSDEDFEDEDVAVMLDWVHFRNIIAS